MAQPIHCDGENHRDALADVMVSQIAVAEVVAFCVDHFADYCRAFIGTYDQAVAEAEAAATAEADATDAEAIARLERAGPFPAPDEDGQDQGLPGPDDEPGDDEGDEPTEASLEGPPGGETDGAGPLGQDDDGGAPGAPRLAGEPAEPATV